MLVSVGLCGSYRRAPGTLCVSRVVLSVVRPTCFPVATSNLLGSSGLTAAVPQHLLRQHESHISLSWPQQDGFFHLARRGCRSPAVSMEMLATVQVLALVSAAMWDMLAEPDVV